MTGATMRFRVEQTIFSARCRIVAIADIVISLDNVSRHRRIGRKRCRRKSKPCSCHRGSRRALIIIGLATSVPLIVAGSAFLMAAAGALCEFSFGRAAVCLGWVAGDMLIKDDALHHVVAPELLERIHHFPIGAFGIDTNGQAGCSHRLGYFMLRSRRAAREPQELSLAAKFAPICGPRP